jgi:hypothetical protein
MVATKLMEEARIREQEALLNQAQQTSRTGGDSSVH